MTTNPFDQAAARDLRVLTYLSNLAQTNAPFLALAELAEKLEISPDRLKRTIENLKAKKAIELERRGNSWRVRVGAIYTGWSVRAANAYEPHEPRTDQAYRSCLTKLSPQCEGVVYGGPGQRRCDPCAAIARTLDDGLSGVVDTGRRIVPRMHGAESANKFMGGGGMAI